MQERSDCKQIYGVADENHLDMLGLDDLIHMEDIEFFVNNFANAISESVKDTVESVSESSYKEKTSKFDIKTIWGGLPLIIDYCKKVYYN